MCICLLELCDYLSVCLDKWLEHILSKRVKLGKPKQNFKLPPGAEPAAYVKKFHRINAPKKWTDANGPPPIGFEPIPESRYSIHNARIDNPYSIKTVNVSPNHYNSNHISNSNDMSVHAHPYHYDPISWIIPSPAILVYDLCLHSSIQLKQTKLFCAFSSSTTVFD